MKRNSGFTLIELMIVIAIVAILSSIAITVYNDSIAKTQLSEAFAVADGLKTPISESFSQTGACPGNGTNGIMAEGSYAGKYIATADTAGTATTGCTITVTFKNTTGVSLGVRGQTVRFTGIDNGGAFTWNCSSAIAAKYKPQTCQ